MSDTRSQAPAGQHIGASNSRNDGLDLIRAIAISLVLVSHFGGGVTFAAGLGVPLPTFLPGYFGVELFFILSGFLIGNLLLDIAEREPSRRAWRIFMVRRAMRTMPAYFVCLIGLIIVAPPHRPLGILPPYFVFAQNLAWPFAEFWFPVSWSLTIEEWFYLCFSAAFIGLAAYFPRKAIWLAIAGFLVVPLLLRAVVSAGVPWDAGIRKVVLYRLDAIAYGVLLATVLRRVAFSDLAARIALVVGTASLVAIAWYWIVVIGKWEIDLPFWRMMIFNLTGIAFALTFPAAIRLRFGAWQRTAWFVRGVSSLSYGLYLVHLSILGFLWPFIVRGPGHAILGLSAAMLGSVIGAYVLRHTVELPLLKRRPAQFTSMGR